MLIRVYSDRQALCSIRMADLQGLSLNISKTQAFTLVGTLTVMDGEGEIKSTRLVPIGLNEHIVISVEDDAQEQNA
jgi:hypothetical protein